MRGVKTFRAQGVVVHLQAVPKEGDATLSCPRGCDRKVSMTVEARYLDMWLLGAGALGRVREGGKKCSAARTLEPNKRERGGLNPQQITTLPSSRQEPRRRRY